MEKFKVFSFNFYLFSGIFIFSFLLTYFLNLYLNSKIEYKFINSLNEEKYEISLDYICKENFKNIENYSNISQEFKKNYYKIYDLIDEDKKLLIKNFRIEGIFPANDELKNKSILYGATFSYDLVYPDFSIKINRVYNKSFFVKNENGKKCINFKID